LAHHANTQIFDAVISFMMKTYFEGLTLANCPTETLGYEKI